MRSFPTLVFLSLILLSLSFVTAVAAQQTPDKNADKSEAVPAATVRKKEQKKEVKKDEKSEEAKDEKKGDDGRYFLRVEVSVDWACRGFG